MPRTCRSKKIGPEHHPLLREIVTAKPRAYMADIGAEFMRRTGLRVHGNTLAEARIKRTHNLSTIAEKQDEVQPEQPKRYAYGPAQCLSDTIAHYASSLRDAEWALVADIFEVTGRGKSPSYPRRLLVDVCC